MTGAPETQAPPDVTGSVASSPWEALAREALTLAAARDRNEILALAAEGAPLLAGMRSCLIHMAEHDLPALVTAGPAATRLHRITPARIDDLRAEVLGRTSVHTPAGGGAGVLADLGLRSWVLVPLGDGAPADLLLVADTEDLPISPVVVQVLEVYASHVSSALRTADALDELRSRSRRDAITDLEHASSFHEALAAAGQDAASGLALLLLDVDNLKQVNERQGHAEGDHLLRALAARLTTALGDQDRLFRVGGDEFGVIAACGSRDDALALAERTRAAARTDRATVSVGVSVRTPEELSTQPSTVEMVTEAELALHAAKRTGRNRVEVYDADMGADVLDRSRMTSELADALHDGQLTLVYQPLIDLPRNRVLGAEALMRWASPDRGEVSPTEFIPLAEETGQIIEMGAWALQEVVAQAVRWDAAGRDLKVAVNVSGVQLRTGFVDEVRDVLSASSLPPERLVLELTESGLVDDEQRIAQIHALRGLGVTVAIDDFGTGYSSLSYLRRLPIDVLKIDRSFVGELHDDRNAAVARTIIELTRVLSLDCVAEGIETAEQVELLTELGCRVVQGFHFARPMEAEAFLPFMEAFERTAGATPDLTAGPAGLPATVGG